MSCTDLMYQPYASYFSYAQRHSAAASNNAYMDSFKKFGFQKLPSSADSMDMGTYPTHGGSGLSSLGSASSLPSSPPGGGHTSSLHMPTSSPPSVHHHSALHGGGPASSSSLSRTSPPVMHAQAKHELADDEDKSDSPRDTQYLAENCVLITYFAGDTASHVDDHFSRALSQPTYGGSTDSTAAVGGGAGEKATSTGSWSTTHHKGGPPMSQRNFPPSFWNSHYQPPSVPSASSLGSTSFDPYHSYPMASSLHGHMPGLSHHQDPWARAAAASYPFTSSQSHGYGSHLHDFTSSYGSMAAASSSRFNPQFSSFMPSKLSSLGSQYDFKPPSSASSTIGSGAMGGSGGGGGVGSGDGGWASRYDPFSASAAAAGSHIAQSHHHHQDTYSLSAYTGSALSGAC